MDARRQWWMPFRPPFSTAGEQFVENTSSCRNQFITLLFYRIKQNPMIAPLANPCGWPPTRRIGVIHWINALGGANGTPWSEVAAKMILMGHPVSSCHVPEVRSCFILFHTLISSWKFCYVHLSLHVITPCFVRFSHLYISTKRLKMSHFRTFLSQNTFSEHVTTPYIVRFSQLYNSKKTSYIVP